MANGNSSSGLTSKQGIGIALGILFITSWIFFRTLRPVKLFRGM